MNLTKDFILQEFVPKDIYEQFHEKSIWFIDRRIPELAQAIRDLIGKPVVINNWVTGGTFSNCGYRVPNCPVGANLSQHKFGRAIDLHFVGVTNYEEIRDKIRFNFDHLKQFGLTTIEKDTPTWLHCDMRWTGLDTLLEVPYR